jgi:glycerol-3-phosphate dehydrogenase
MERNDAAKPPRARGALSALERARTLDALEREDFDCVVIGGGITGAGVAREAALRGLRVALLEARDFAAGTSSRSSKLIHGGLRYLAMGDIPLVRDTALERKRVFALAPHLAERRWMLVPARSYAGVLKFRAGLATYEKLGAVEEADRHRNWDADDLAREEPLLRAEAQYACVYRGT